MAYFCPTFALRIQHPQLNETPPGNSIYITVIEPSNQSQWQVNLTKVYDFLKIKVMPLGINGLDVQGEYMHLIPMNGGKPIMFGVNAVDLESCRMTPLHVHSEYLQHAGQYEFYIVQSNRKELPWFFCAPESKKPPTLPAYEESASIAVKDIMPSLLRDIYSVDVRFGFKTAGQESDIRLWAHRTVLAKYPMFDDLLKQSSFENKSSPLGSLKLSVTKVSFPVFATLLKFLYTGVVDRMVYPSDFAISKIPAVWPQAHPAGGNKEKYEWHPLDLEKPLSPTPVPWKSLLDAANVYKVHALCARCEAALKSGAEDGKTITTDTK